MPLIYVKYSIFDDCCNSGVNGQVTLSFNAGHQRGRGGVEFYVFGTNYAGFYNWFSWIQASHIVSI